MNLPLLLDQVESAPIRAQFYLKVTDKSVALAKARLCRSRVMGLL